MIQKAKTPLKQSNTEEYIKCLLQVGAIHLNYQIPKPHVACNISCLIHHSKEHTQVVNRQSQPREIL